jgi:4-hydroxybenzoate polyprenyltransferase
MNVLGVLRLIRPPNVFTAFSDAAAGLLVLRGLGIALPAHALAIIAASGCLYLAGIVLNDVLDRDIDARERPRRPIPSGQVDLGFAAALGVGLLVVGVVIAWWIGRSAGLVALALAGSIVAYDAGLKRTLLGPFVMGACRGLNVALAISTGLAIDARWPTIAIAAPVVLALYIEALKYIARDEVDGNTARRARTGLVGLGALLIVAPIALLLASDLPRSAWAWPWVGYALYRAWTNWAPVWKRHDARSTGRAIGGGIMLIPLIDASFVAIAGCPFWAIAVALFAVPATVLKEWFSPT